MSASSVTAFPGNYSTAEAGVFWDINQCEIPDLSAAEATQNMRHTLFNKGHRGTVKIKAYGDKKYYDFLSAGVDINPFTAEDIYERHTKMFEDVVSWAAENPELFAIGNFNTQSKTF